VGTKEVIKSEKDFQFESGMERECGKSRYSKVSILRIGGGDGGMRGAGWVLLEKH
jgi:hypothetical protein